MALTPDADIQNRRKTLKLLNNPSPELDYVVTLKAMAMLQGLPEAVRLQIRYVPDQLSLDPGSLDTYIEVLREQEWSSLEEVGAALLTDLGNELVARWTEVFLETRRTGTNQGTLAENHHLLLLTDQQPKWSNPDLLARLPLSG